VYGGKLCKFVKLYFFSFNNNGFARMPAKKFDVVKTSCTGSDDVWHRRRDDVEP